MNTVVILHKLFNFFVHPRGALTDFFKGADTETETYIYTINSKNETFGGENMARPAKSIDIQSGNIQNDIIQGRRDIENTLKGDSAADVEPAFEISERQSAIFNKIKKMFDQVGLLGELDCYVLTEGAVVIDRLNQIEEYLNEHPGLPYDRDICNTRKEYMQNFFRICNELSLSPQSRAKMGIIASNKDSRDSDPILRLFGSDET